MFLRLLHIRKRWIGFLCFWALVSIFLSQAVNAQDKEQKDKKEKFYQLNGYVKDLRTFFLFNKFDNLTQENRIHNRLNYEWFKYPKWIFEAELRTQLIYGEFPKTYNTFITDNEPLINLINSSPDLPNVPTSYGQLLAPAQGLLDLSWTPIDDRTVILNTYLDRLAVEYIADKWQLKVGRQRINWGINWVWNPNDLFNTFSFIDFDYEERPGSDAIRFQYFTQKGMSFELAGGFQEQFDQSILATKIGWNKWNYDFQGIASWYQEELALGFGWAGNLGSIAGFKGEATWFEPLIESQGKENGLVASLGFDFSFQNGLLVQTEFLYNSFGITETDGGLLGNAFGGQSLSPKNLWTYKYGVFLGTSFSISPLVQTSLAFIFNPSDQSYFLNPSITWSIKQNLDLLFLVQYTGKQSFPPPFNTLFGDFYGSGNLRLKWSF